MFNKKSLFIATAIMGSIVAQGCATQAAYAQQTSEIPRAPSTPNTPKNWVGPNYTSLAQKLVNDIERNHPELVSITIHAVPPGLPANTYSMIAGTFPDRIGNESSPGDAITAVKGVSQVESKWGTENYNKKVSIVLPLKDQSGDYLPVAIVLAFKQSPDSGLIDTDFLAPGLRIREDLAPLIPSKAALFEKAR